MSKKRSLGSSPIGFKSDDNSMGFIPDLGVSKAKKDRSSSSQSTDRTTNGSTKNGQTGQETSKKQKKSEKKIVSYNLEVDLINRIKTLAQEQDIYYSSLVSSALKQWIAENS